MISDRAIAEVAALQESRRREYLAERKRADRRDQLAAVIYEADTFVRADLADAILRAGYRPPPRVIYDADEADQLPAGTVVITDAGQVAQRYDGMGGWWQTLDGADCDSAVLIDGGRITVLRDPEEVSGE